MAVRDWPFYLNGRAYLGVNALHVFSGSTPLLLHRTDAKKPREWRGCVTWSEALAPRTVRR